MESVAKRGKRTRSKSIHLDDANKDVNGDNQEQVDKDKLEAGVDKPKPDGDEQQAPAVESETSTTEPQNDEGKVNDTSTDADTPASEEKTEKSPVEEKKAEEKKPEVELPKLRGRKRAVTTSETSETKDQNKSSSEPSKKGEQNEPDNKAAAEPKSEPDKPEVPETRLRSRKSLVVIEAAAIPMETEEKDSTEKKGESDKKAEEKNKKSAESEKKTVPETPKSFGRGRKRGASEMAVDNSTPEVPPAPAAEEAAKPQTNGECYLVYLLHTKVEQQTNAALNSLDLIG